LAEGITLTGTLARRTKGQALRQLTPQDLVICWGDNFAAPAGIRTLNNVAPLNKFAEAQRLAEKGVPTIQVSRTKPAAAAARPGVKPPFVDQFFTPPAAYQRGQLGLAQTAAIVAEMQGFLRTEQQRRAQYDAARVPPGAPAEIWLPRKNNHVGGNDLLQNDLQNPDFYSKKLDIVEEYRLHVFRGKSIRAGKKVAQPTRPDGRTAPHQWIRSFDAGWVIKYDQFESNKQMREVAKNAVKALGLDFAAVDIGKLANGTYVALEVNRAPGVEGGTVTAYARAIQNWIQNPNEAAE
jgi:hypothetical protein